MLRRLIILIVLIAVIGIACSEDGTGELTNPARVAQDDLGRPWFGVAWPLTVHVGILGCEGFAAVYFETAAGERYGLNGFGTSRWGKTDPIWAADFNNPRYIDDPKTGGVIESGKFFKKNIGALLDTGLELCE